MDFKLDESLPVEVARQFSEAGHSALTVLDEGLGGQPDRAIADRCKAERRSLDTLDVGFGDIRAYPPSEYAGLIVLQLKRQDRESVSRILNRLLDLIRREQLAGRLWIADEERVRIRG